MDLYVTLFCIFQVSCMYYHIFIIKKTKQKILCFHCRGKWFYPCTVKFFMLHVGAKKKTKNLKVISLNSGTGKLDWLNGWAGKPNKLSAATAKSLESCPTLCDPIDRSPPGSPVPGILQARTLEWVAISFSNA